MLLMVTPAPLCHLSRSLSFHSCINCFVQYFGDPTLQCAFYRSAHVQCSVGWVKHSCSLQCKTQFDQHCNLKISPTVLSTSWFDQYGWSVHLMFDQCGLSVHLMFDQYGWSVHCVRAQSNGNYASQTEGIPMCSAEEHALVIISEPCPLASGFNHNCDSDLALLCAIAQPNQQYPLCF